MKRQTLIALFLAGTMAAGVGGWMAGRLITSPAEAAARTAPPDPSPILVPVEERILTTDIVTRGEARFGSPRVLAMAGSVLKPDSGVVTMLPSPGDGFAEGDVVLSASGRPVFILEGVAPIYRDLGPGRSGDDVRQLEAALARLGFDPGPEDGVYDEATGAAVEAWYRAGGWEPFQATAEQLSAIRALEQDLAAARTDGLGAIDAVGSAEVEVVSAKAAVGTAQDAVAQTGLEISAVEAEIAVNDKEALSEVTTSRAWLDQLLADPGSTGSRKEADAAVAEAQAALGPFKAAHLNALDNAATAALNVTAAQAEATAADDATAVEVAIAQAVVDALLLDPAATPAEIAAAETDLSLALSAQETIRLAGIVAVQTARDDKAAADREVALTAADLAAAEAVLADAVAYRALLDDAGLLATEIDRATAALANAQARADAVAAAGRSAVQAAVDAKAATIRELTVARATLTAAQASLANARSQSGTINNLPESISTDLDAALLQAGVQVPADEIIFVPSATVRVEKLEVAVGDPASGPVITVTDNRMAIDSSLPLNEAPLVSAGMTVSIDEPELGISGIGTVSRVAEQPGTDGVDGFHVYFEVVIDEAPLSIIGVAARLTIPIESSGGPVLAVPVAALSLAADGSSRVQVTSGSSVNYVTVEPLLAADGYVQVRPIDGSLSAGDLVIIGFDQPGAASAG